MSLESEHPAQILQSEHSKIYNMASEDDYNQNYNNFGGGFGGIRHGFNNPHLNRRYWSHPPLAPIDEGVARYRSRSPLRPRIVDVTDEIEEHVPRPSSARRCAECSEADMSEAGSSLESPDYPMTGVTDRTGGGDIKKPAMGWQAQPRNSEHFYACGVLPLGASDRKFTSMAPNPTARFNPGQNNPNERIPYTPMNRPLPSIQNLLNPSSPSQLFQNQGNQPSQFSPERTSFGISYPLPPNTPVSSYASAGSSTTTRGPSDIAEQRYVLLVNLYNTCLDASSNYIRSLVPSSRVRQGRMRQVQGSRYHSYYPSQARAGPPPRPRKASREPTLMDNISEISTHIWREARRSIMGPHRAEADTVRVMRDLYAWGEVVVKGMENSGVYDGDEDDERSAVTGLVGLPEDGATKVAEAAKLFCRWLKDRDSWDVCHRIFEKLGDLERREMGEASVDGNTTDEIR